MFSSEKHPVYVRQASGNYPFRSKCRFHRLVKWLLRVKAPWALSRHPVIETHQLPRYLHGTCTVGTYRTQLGTYRTQLSAYSYTISGRWHTICILNLYTMRCLCLSQFCKRLLHPFRQGPSTSCISFRIHWSLSNDYNIIGR